MTSRRLDHTDHTELEPSVEPIEWLWHVSDDDVPLGRIERTRAHAEQITHRSGIVFLLDTDANVYLTRRAATKRIFPACHDSSASFHVAYGESYAEAAAREAAEELGVTGPLQLLGRFCHHDPPEHQWVAVFVMTYEGGPIALDPTEASSGAFLALDEAARVARHEPCTPWLRDGLPLLLAHWSQRG